MSAAFALACLSADLERAVQHAKEAHIGWHFVSECDHLLATARHNLAEAMVDGTILHNDNGNESNESKENNQ